MSPLPDQIRRSFGTETVVLVRRPGTDDEERLEVEALIQPKSGLFGVETPVYEGDIIEVQDPRGGVGRRLAAEVKQHNPKSSQFAQLVHTEVVWGKAPQVRSAPVRRLSLENLHPDVIAAASDLFADEHYDSAITEAFKSVDIRVRTMISSEQSGTKLMNEAFAGANPKLPVTTSNGQSGKDEQEGFAALFRGSMLGLRNPRAHELATLHDPHVALEYLALASLLHRRLDLSTS